MLRALRNKYPPGSRLLWVCGDDVLLSRRRNRANSGDESCFVSQALPILGANEPINKKDESRNLALWIFVGIVCFEDFTKTSLPVLGSFTALIGGVRMTTDQGLIGSPTRKARRCWRSWTALSSKEGCTRQQWQR